MPLQTSQDVTAWSQLRHRIIALEFRGLIRKIEDEATRVLGYVPVFLNGPGPSDSFWEDQRDVIALRKGYQLDMDKLARPSRRPTRDEGKVQEEKELSFLKKLIDGLYEILRKDWIDQGQKESSTFLREIHNNGFRYVVLDILHAQTSIALPEGSASARLAALLGKLPMRRRLDVCNYIQRDLKDRVQLEALKLEHTEKSPSRQEEPVELKESTSHLVNRTGRRERRVVEPLDSETFHAYIRTIKKEHPEWEVRQMCEKLDQLHGTPKWTPPRTSWQKKSQQSLWVGNYDHPSTKSSVKTFFSKVLNRKIPA